MDVELRTYATNPALALRNLHRWPESPPDPAGWQSLLVVRSGAFAAERAFDFDELVLGEFIRDLREMDRTLNGQATLPTRYEEAYLRLVLNPMGSVTVSGVLVEETGVRQRLEFGFRTDQTVLRPFVRDLEIARMALTRSGAAAV